jgi:hypothetical protein
VQNLEARAPLGEDWDGRRSEAPRRRPDPDWPTMLIVATCCLVALGYVAELLAQAAGL